LLPRAAATKRSASSTQRETWVTKITDEHDVVVVGAGAAGIAATRRLIEAGVDVLLLEARNRVGGTPPSFQNTCAFLVRRIGRLQAPTKCDPSAGR